MSYETWQPTRLVIKMAGKYANRLPKTSTILREIRDQTVSTLYKYMSLKEGILMEIRKDTAVFV